MGAMVGSGANVVDFSGTVLVCMDRTTGARRWIRRLTLDGLPAVECTGTPAGAGEHVYAAWRSRPGVEPRSAGVVCVRRRTGEVAWQRQVATLDARVDEPWGAHVIVSDDGASLFVQTDLGVIARLDAAGRAGAAGAAGGRVVWAAVYPRERERAGRAAEAQVVGGRNAGRLDDRQTAARAWHLAPPILTPTVLVALPTSAAHVVILDPATGRSVKGIGREVEWLGEMSRAARVLHADASRLLLLCDDRVFALDWPRYAGQGPDGRKLDADNTHWIARFARVAGRPAFAAEHLIIAAASVIFAVALGQGVVRHRYPPRGRTWPAGEGAGNLLLTDGHLVVATRERINVYATTAKE